MIKLQNLTRRELLRILQGVSVLPVVGACKDREVEREFKDLTNYTSDTVVSDQRYDEVLERFKISDWIDNGPQKGTAIEQAAVLPDEYLAFLLKRSQDPRVRFKVTWGGVAPYSGMCWFDGVGATKIQLENARFAAIHEFGHGVENESYRLRGISSGASLREQTYLAVKSSSEQNLIRPYSKNNSKELFADGFSSFYRSPASRAALRKMPHTFEFLQSVLIAPVNLSADEDASKYFHPNGSGGRPGGGSTTPTNSRGREVPTEIGSGDERLTAGPGTNFGDDQGRNTVRKGGPGGGGRSPIVDCGNPRDAFVSILCSLARSYVRGEFSLTGRPANEILLPQKDQFLAAEDSSLFLAGLQMSKQEIEESSLFIDHLELPVRIVKDPYSADPDIYSTIFSIPKRLAPERGYARKTLRLKRRGRDIMSVTVNVSRHSICGPDVSDAGFIRKV